MTIPSVGAVRDRTLGAVREFLRLQSAGGILLAVAAVLALVLANTRAQGLYQAFLEIPVEFRIATFTLAKPLLLWINDGLMAVFFFLIGLEIKREVMEGELSNRSQITLPVSPPRRHGSAGARVLVDRARRPFAVQGWAIPAATDIAFALGVLSLVGTRVPRGLTVFLLTLAILDDLGSILIIALVYTERLSWLSLSVAAGALVLLAVFNAARVKAIPAHFFVGLVLWVAVLKSGIHATLAGVMLALFIPMRAGGEDGASPLRQLEHDLHPIVAFGIMPLFAIANAGVSLQGMSLATLAAPVPLGIAVGLLAGKTIGVFGASAAAIALGAARMPEGTTWGSLLGTAVLCGIGFTMSLFIANLAFAETAPELAVSAVVGILVASFLAAVAGSLVLAATLPPRPPAATERTSVGPTSA